MLGPLGTVRFCVEQHTMTDEKNVSNLQIVGAAAALAACVATLLALVPGRDPAMLTSLEPTSFHASTTTTQQGHDTPQMIAALEDGTDATRQVYALDRPASGVLVTLGTAHLRAAALDGAARPLSAIGAKFVAARQPTGQIVSPRHAARPLEFETDDALVEAAIQAGQLTRGESTSEARQHRVEADKCPEQIRADQVLFLP